MVIYPLFPLSHFPPFLFPYPLIPIPYKTVTFKLLYLFIMIYDFFVEGESVETHRDIMHCHRHVTRSRPLWENGNLS